MRGEGGRVCGLLVEVVRGGLSGGGRVGVLVI